MLQRTVSESLFEQFCDHNHVAWARITPNGVAGHKHPDYKIVCSGNVVIVEVKEVGESQARSVLRKQLELSGPADVSEPRPDEQVRKMVYSGSKQIRSARGKNPALIVLYDDESIIPIDGQAIRAGMYGQNEVAIGSTAGPSRTRHHFGAGQSVSKNQNTTLSAVALLTGQTGHPSRLDFYHNQFAKMPFNPDWLRTEAAAHYRLAAHIAVGGLRDWESF